MTRWTALPVLLVLGAPFATSDTDMVVALPPMSRFELARPDVEPLAPSRFEAPRADFDSWTPSRFQWSRPDIEPSAPSGFLPSRPDVE